MMRLRNPQNGVQVVVTDEKAALLITDGVFQAVPATEQPADEAVPREQAAKVSSQSGLTSIAAAIKAGAGPLWDYAGR